MASIILAHTVQYMTCKITPRRRLRGFTLLELMIAFIVLAILSAIAVPSLLGVAKSDQQNADTTTAIAVADQVYYQDVQSNTTLPTSTIITDYGTAASPFPQVSSVSPASATGGPINAAEFTFTDKDTVCVTVPTVTGDNPSAISCSTVATVPGAPTSVAGTSNAAHESSVSWTAPSSDGNSSITSYVVQYSSDSGSTWTTATTSASSSPYVVTGLTDGTSYIFQVAATNAVGTGPFSSLAGTGGTDGGSGGGSGSTPGGATPTGAPSTPAPTVSANTTPGTLTFSWAASTDGDGTLTYYWALSPAAGSCTALSNDTTSLTATCTGITPGTTYTFSVFSQDSLGRTSVGVGSITATAIQTAPAAPTGVSGTADTHGSSSVSWVDPDNGGSTITGYTVRYSSDSGATWTTATTSAPDTPYTVTGLTDGTSYIFEVSATNAIGTSPFSAPSSGATPTGAPSTPSPAVTTNSNQGSTGTMTFTWAASTDGRGTITYYWQLSPATTGCSSIVDTTGLTATCDDVTPGTAYTLSVYAEDSLSRVSSVGSATASAHQDVPGAPTGVAGVPDTANQSSLSWTAPSNNGGSAITGYSIRYSSNGGSSWTTIAAGSSSPHNVTGLTDGTAYIFEVEATNAVGTSAWSAASAPVTPTGAPSTPSPSVTTNTNQDSTGTMTWTWTASTDGKGTITYYWSLSSAAGACSTSGSETTTSVTCASVAPGTSYTFSVYAEDSLSRVSSTGSTTATAVQNVPSTPTGLAANGATSDLNDYVIPETWTAPAHTGGAAISDYLVRYSIDDATWTVVDTGSTATAYSLTVANNDTYYIEVAAENAAGQGPWSSPDTVTWTQIDSYPTYTYEETSATPNYSLVQTGETPVYTYEQTGWAPCPSGWGGGGGPNGCSRTESTPPYSRTYTSTGAVYGEVLTGYTPTYTDEITSYTYTYGYVQTGTSYDYAFVG